MVRTLFGNVVPVRALPAIVPCPLCSSSVNAAQTMRVMDDPTGGLYWYCYACRTGFDSLELLVKAGKFNGLRAVFDWMVRNPEVFMPVEFTKIEAFERYMAWCAMPHERWQTWSTKARNDWLHDRDSHAMVTEHIGASVKIADSAVELSRRSGQWFHATTRKALQAELNNNLAPGLPTDSFSSCVAVPWCRRPGRPHALMLLGWRKQCRLWQPMATTVQDAGVMLLDALPPEPQRVLAVSSPFLALWLHHKNFQETARPIPVVAWHDNTNPEIWGQLGVQEIVFWGYQVTPGLLRQALQARCKTFISVLEKPVFDIAYTEDSIEHYKTFSRFRELIDVPMPSNQRVAQFSSTVNDPYDVALDYMFKCSPEELTTVMAQLRLDPETVARVLNRAIDPAVRELMYERVMRTSEALTCQLFGTTTVQRVGLDSACWAIRRGPAEEVISDAVVLLDSGAIDMDTDTTVYTGVVAHKGQRYPFRATRDELKKSPVDMIIKSVERAGGGTPFVSRYYENRFWDLIFRFSNIVKTCPGITRVGWSRDHAEFILPRFSVRHGKLVPATNNLIGERRLPAVNLETPRAITADELKPWMEPTEVSAAMWAILASMASNVMAPLSNQSPRGIALTGALAERVARRVAQNFELVVFPVATAAADIHQFELAQRDNDLPVYVDANSTQLSTAALTAWIGSTSSKNCLMPISSTQLPSALLCGGWTSVNTGTDTGVIRSGTCLAGVFMNWLAWMQHRELETPPTGAPVLSALLLLEEWAKETAKTDIRYVFDAARRMVMDPGTMSGAQRFVHMLVYLSRGGYLAIRADDDLNEAATNGPAIVVDRNHSRVLVSKRKVVVALHRLSLPTVDTLMITAQLAEDGMLLGELGENGSIWAIDIRLWDRIERTKTQDVLTTTRS